MKELQQLNRAASDISKKFNVVLINMRKGEYQMKGKELIRFIQENNLEDKNIYIHKTKDINPEVVELKDKSLFIDELGDLLLTSYQTVSFFDPRGTLTEDYKKKGYDVTEINLENIKNTAPWNPIENANTEQLKTVKKILEQSLNKNGDKQ